MARTGLQSPARRVDQGHLTGSSILNNQEQTPQLSLCCHCLHHTDLETQIDAASQCLLCSTDVGAQASHLQGAASRQPTRPGLQVWTVLSSVLLGCDLPCLVGYAQAAGC